MTDDPMRSTSVMMGALQAQPGPTPPAVAPGELCRPRYAGSPDRAPRASHPSDEKSGHTCHRSGTSLAAPTFQNSPLHVATVFVGKGTLSNDRVCFLKSPRSTGAPRTRPSTPEPSMERDESGATNTLHHMIREVACAVGCYGRGHKYSPSRSQDGTGVSSVIRRVPGRYRTPMPAVWPLSNRMMRQPPEPCRYIEDVSPAISPCRCSTSASFPQDGQVMRSGMRGHQSH
jgi:hypothetical protein